MSLVKTVRTAVDSGNVILGTKQTLKEVISGDAKFIVVASNCEKNSKEDLLRYAKISGVEVQDFDGSGVELGEVCGKPYIISMLAVVEKKKPKATAKGKK